MAEAKKPAPAADNDGGAKPKKNMLMMVVIILLVLLIAVLGAGAFVAYKVLIPPTFEDPVAEHAADGSTDDAASKDKKKKKEKKEKDPAAVPVFTKLDTFTVNLPNGSVLQTEIHVQVSDEKQTDLIKNYLPRLSSQVNLLLGSKKLEDLTTYEGKVKLMDEIKQTLNKVLDAKEDEDGVMSVEFKTFIIQ
ncbi:flagellar basal body-associated FliL family protein [Chitinimonas sp. BJYL2]|uniref:flagellar basal body-associated FliL family protein n=1 Tax=Chitinimonas sp. BJYL2 TaxID=2976696 RepID=UPI0022B4F73E|nr:flagellar basal body-associated FliL family protein [Chitinimonas sp. BJYL2]